MDRELHFMPDGVTYCNGDFYFSEKYKDILKDKEYYIFKCKECGHKAIIERCRNKLRKGKFR